MLLLGSMMGRPSKPKTTPAASPPPEPEIFGPPAPPSYPYSITVESGTFKSIRPPLEWRDITPLAVLTGLNGTGKTQLLRSISMMYADAAAKEADIRLKIEGLSCKPHEVLFLEDFAKPFSDVASGIAQLTTLADQYRKEKAKEGNPYDKQIRHFFHNTKVIDNSNLHEAFYRNPIMLSRAIAHHCTAYVMHRGQRIEKLYMNREYVDPSSLVGTPPWEEINDWFEQSYFPYRRNSPR